MVNDDIFKMKNELDEVKVIQKKKHKKDKANPERC